MMATIPARVPSPAEVDEFTNHLGHAISFLDESQSSGVSIEDGLAAHREGRSLDHRYLTPDEAWLLFMVATEATEAADELRRYADRLLAALPDMVDRDRGYSVALGGDR
jgi:hypothetical protein